MGEGMPELKITYACRSDVGKVRDHNEDYATVEVPSDPEKRRKGKLFIIADGMGGHQAGEVASERAVRTTLIEYYNAQADDVPSRLRAAVQAANTEVHQMAQANIARAGMGTTIVMAAVIGREVHIANVGDSRAYLVRNNTITQITTDHSFVGEQVKAGILTKEQAKAHPQRNVITRALGSGPAVQVDTYQGELQEGDVIVLCSDGLTEHVPDNVLQETVSHHDPEQSVIRLIELAKEGGGSDNISVIVLRAEPNGASARTVVGKSPPAPPMVKSGPPSGDGKQAARPLAAPRPAPSPQRARRSVASLLWAVGGVIIALGLVTVLIGAMLVWRGRLLGGGGDKASPTPTLTPTAVVPPMATPTPTLTVIPTQTLAPTSTVSPTPKPPTRKPTPTATDTPTPTPTPTPTTEQPQGGGGGGGGKPPTLPAQPSPVIPVVP